MEACGAGDLTTTGKLATDQIKALSQRRRLLQGFRTSQQLRQVAPYLGDIFKQSIIVENKVGAGGVLATQFVAQSAPDGYTLLLGSNIQLIQKILKPELSINPLNDFVPISNM